jgi:large subunit ribosomal protein L24
MAKMNIKKGDKVVVISGKDKGVEGSVIAAYPRKGRVTVEKVNVVTKAIHPSQANTQGGLAKMEAPIDVSNVMLVCPSCNKPTRVGHKIEDGKKSRVCKKCGAVIE